MNNEQSYKELQDRLKQLRVEGRNAEANDLEIWIDYRLEQARETVEGALEVLNAGQEARR